MSSDLLSKMEQLERKLSVQRAFLAAQIHFPKGFKVPEDVKVEVVEALKEAAVKLAEGLVESQNETFSSEEVKVLKLLANKAMGKASTIEPEVNKMTVKAPIVVDKGVLTPTETFEVDLANLNSCVGRKATLATLEAVPVRQRGKVPSGSEVLIEAARPDGLLHVITAGGVRFNVDPTLLDFN